MRNFLSYHPGSVRSLNHLDWFFTITSVVFNWNWLYRIATRSCIIFLSFDNGNNHNLFTFMYHLLFYELIGSPLERLSCFKVYKMEYLWIQFNSCAIFIVNVLAFKVFDLIHDKDWFFSHINSFITSQVVFRMFNDRL